MFLDMCQKTKQRNARCALVFGLHTKSLHTCTFRDSVFKNMLKSDKKEQQFGRDLEKKKLLCECEI